MGADIRFGRHIHIAKETWSNGVLEYVGYNDIDEQKLTEIRDNKKIKWIQISDYLPDEAYEKIDQILSMRPDVTFRLFHFLNEKQIDISFLRSMPNVKRLDIDCIDFRNDPEKINLSVLTELGIRSLHISCFDLRDYSFIQDLSTDMEELLIMADTMGAGIKFDCKWLLKYKKLHTLYLGKKAKKNLECISQLSELKSFALRGIKITDFSFLKRMHLEKLALLWNSNNDLHELADLSSLRELELWRINKLRDISFIKDLVNLKVIKLQDLKHVTYLPDLSMQKGLQRIYLINTGINTELLPGNIKEIVRNWDDR